MEEAGGHPPTLETERLVLRSFRLADADVVRVLAGDIDVARNTLRIPHPYDREQAEAWITSHPSQFERGEAVTYAITAPGTGVVGAVGLILDREHRRAELGYWIGRPYWNRGYATEAAGAVVDWGFRELDLHRIHACHFPRNAASAQVLKKIGMRPEGTLREHILKWDEFLDLACYGMLRAEREGE